MPEPRAVLVKACLNGSRRPGEHPALSLTPADLAREGRSAVAAGAAALHVHPRLASGSQTLDPAACAATIQSIRAACPGVPVGLTTSASIEPDPARRLAVVESWTTRPDFASVNLWEQAALALCHLLFRLGIGVEAALETVADAHALIDSGFADRCLRVVVDPHKDDPNASLTTAVAIDSVLDRVGLSCPRVHHGHGRGTWVVLDDALRRGHHIRIGLEDTLELRDGRPARDNAELVELAVALALQHGRRPIRYDGE